MARKAAAADPDSGTTNVNIADFQRTRDSVRSVLEVSSVSLLLLRVKTGNIVALYNVNIAHRTSPCPTPT
jgi:hypothetical protein